MVDKQYCGKVEDPQAAALLAAAEEAGGHEGAQEDDGSAGELICKMPIYGEKCVELRRGDKSVMVATRRFFDENNFTYKGFVDGVASINFREPGETAGDIELFAIKFATLCCKHAHDLRYKDDGQSRVINVGSNAIEISAEARAKSRLLQALGIYEQCRLVPEACFQLGLSYERGDGVRKNLSRAKELYQEAFERALSLTGADVYDDTGGEHTNLRNVSGGEICPCPPPCQTSYRR